jgi:hypothetical protein
MRAGDIELLSAGHQNSENAVSAKRLDAERGDDRGILTARNADNGAASRSVLFEPIFDPFDAFFGRADGIEFIFLHI